MNSILSEPRIEHKVDVMARLDEIIAQLPDADRAEVWCGVALNLAEGIQMRVSHDATHRPRL